MPVVRLVVEVTDMTSVEGTETTSVEASTATTREGGREGTGNSRREFRREIQEGVWERRECV